MRVRLGLVVPAEARALFQRGLVGISGVEPVWAVYSDETSIESAVAEIAHRCDALCFAGRLSLERARPVIPEDMPFAEVRPTPVDIAVSFLRARSIGMEIAPVSIDTVGHSMVADLLAELGLRDDMVAVLPFDNESTPEQIAQFHRDQRTTIGARYALTARNSVFKILDGTSDLPVVRIVPTVSTITATVRELSLRAVSVRKEDLRLAVAVFRALDPASEPGDRPPSAVMAEYLARTAGWKHGWIDARSEEEVFVIGHKKLMEDMTVQWQSLDVLDDLSTRVGGRVVAGFGLGATTQECVHYAVCAADRAAQADASCAYLMTEQGMVLGPMSQHDLRPLRFRFKSDDEALDRISQQTGLGTATVTQLIDLENRLGGESVSADQIGSSLNLTPTSGRRILRALRESGMVVPVGMSQPSRRGRPKGLYRLDLQRHLNSEDTPIHP